MARNLAAELAALVPELAQPCVGWHGRLVAPGFMDLVVEVVGEAPHGGFEISLAHYYEQNGDLVADPEMTLWLYPAQGVVLAATFAMPGLGVLRRARWQDRDIVYLNRREAIGQTAFLRTWLQNLRQQGHRPIRRDAA